MPSQEDYLDSLLNNLEHDAADTNNMEKHESSSGEPADADALIENAVSELEAAFDSDDNLNLEKLLGLESIHESDMEVDQNVGETSESTLSEEGVSELTEVMGDESNAAFGEKSPWALDAASGEELEPEPDVEHGEETLPKLDVESGESQTSEHEADELDLDEVYSDIGLFLGENAEMETDSKVRSVEQDAAPDLEALGSMSEDEIERLLSAGAEEDSAPLDKETLSDDEELLNMLGGLEDDDLQDINEILHRADNNEAVDESLLQRDSDNENGASRLPGGEDDLQQNTLSEKEQRAQKKKLSKQERAAAKAAAKAEKAAAKAAAKAEKAAAKAAAMAEKAAAKAVTETGAAVVGSVSEGSLDENLTTTNDKNKSSGTLFDTSLLDSIVAGAEQTGSEGKATAAPEAPRDVNSGKNAGGSSAAQDENDLDEFDFNMDSLFGADGNVDLSSQNDSKNPDFVEPNTEEADAVISGHEEPEPKKGGFLAKIIDFLTEEDEEEEENESLQLSKENRDILNDLDKEKAGDKNKKKKKGASNADKGEKGKAKKSKAKKPKASKKPKAPKKPKKPKAEKPKKEKLPEPEPLIPEQKLTLKRVLPIALVGVSLGVFIIVLTNASVDFVDKQAATEAYYAGDYQTCFQNLYGKNLNETEQLMFGKSESILYIRLWLREYEMFAQDGAEVEALDSLIQTVSDYPKLYEYAVQWDAGAEVAAGYQTILNILLEKYGLTEEQAREIAAESSDRKYTRMIVEIVQGNAVDSRNEQLPVSDSVQLPSVSESEQTALQDVLPEEEGLGEGEFIGN